MRRAFTSRSGGVSKGVYAGLNLGAHVADDPLAVDENRRRLAVALGVAPDRLAFMNQCHGADVAIVETPTAATELAPAVDGIITTRPDVALVVLVADCVPILLHSADGSVLAAAHAGRQGMMKGVVPQVVSRMRSLGAGDIRAMVGPSVCGRCYEVPAELRDEAADISPESRTVSWTGTPAIDVAAGVVAQLRGLDIAVEWVPGCSREDQALFSHRRDGVTGRFAGVIVGGSA